MYFENDDIGLAVEEIKNKTNALTPLLLDCTFPVFSMQKIDCEKPLDENGISKDFIKLEATDEIATSHQDKVELLVTHLLPIERKSSEKQQSLRKIGLIKVEGDEVVLTQLLDLVLEVNRLKQQLKKTIQRDFSVEKNRAALYAKHPLLLNIRVKTLFRAIPIINKPLRSSTFAWSQSELSIHPMKEEEALEYIANFPKPKEDIEEMLNLYHMNYDGNGSELILVKSVKAHPIHNIRWVEGNDVVKKVVRAHTPLLVISDELPKYKTLQSREIEVNMKALEEKGLNSVVSSINLYQRTVNKKRKPQATKKEMVEK